MTFSLRISPVAMLALARKIVNGEEDDAESVEAVFTQARDAEASAEEYLVDDGWNINVR